MKNCKMFKRIVSSAVCFIFLFPFQVSATTVGEAWIPLRKTAEDYGALVEWDEAAHSATVTLGNVKVTVKPTGGEAVIVDNIMFVPLDFTTDLERASLVSIQNLKDLDGFRKSEKVSFSVDLDSWGIINFISGEFVGDIEYPAAFLVDDKDNILYEFSNLSTTATEIIDVLIKDLNGDGLKDVKITLAFFDYDTDKIISDMPNLERLFYQIENGLFSVQIV